MHARHYSILRVAGGLIKTLCIRESVLSLERSQAPGPLLLAVSHISHIEPFLVSSVVDRPIHWMARVEFFRPGWRTAILNHFGAISVDRAGCSIRPIRGAIRLLTDNRPVGIFPEGGVTTGPDSVLRGGPIKQGVCTIAIRARVPILPVVVIGADTLNRIGPWLPFRRGRIWIAFGRPVHPRPERSSNRPRRAELAARLRSEFVHTYQQLLTSAGLEDRIVP